jgi:predicted nucleotidyltransferase component of viral defense system
LSVTQVKNTTASVRQRLLNISREKGEDFNLILIRYAAERLLYRLSVSEYADHFILKGAMLFSVWFDAPHRSTRDLDFLAHGEPDIAQFQRVFETLCRQPVQKDGLQYDPKTIQIESIREPDEYGGLRVRMKSFLGDIPIPVQVDMGFGDIVTPKERIIEYPTLLDLPTPKLKSYPPETMVAEKFHAMVYHGIAISRMKDFYDLYILKQNHAFNKKQLTTAIKATFQRRKTKIPSELPVALSDKFSDDPTKSTQWSSFIKRNDIKDAPGELTIVIENLREFFSQYFSFD